MKRINRLQFLKMLGCGSAASLAGAAGLWPASWAGVKEPPSELPPELIAEEIESDWLLGHEKWVPSFCLQCPTGCGIKVRVIGGRAVKIEGNPYYPVNLGRLCPKGQAGLQVLYDPDRIKGPLKRVGERGLNQWESISWEQALNEVARELKKLRDKGMPHTLAIMSGRSRGQMVTLIERFLKAYGSPNDLRRDSVATESIKIGNYLTQGHRNYFAYDWDNTNYVLSFGLGFLEAGRPAMRLLRAYGHLHQGRAGRRAKIVQVDPRFSITSAKADEWVPINPGTDGALALGLAYVIIRRGLYGEKFVREQCFGFDEWADDKGQHHQGFQQMVLQEYSPSFVSQITGVPEETINRLAEEFAGHRPAVAIAGRGVSMRSNAIFTQMAINSLNALVGSIGEVGGIWEQPEPPLEELAPVVKDPVAEEGLGHSRIDAAASHFYPLSENVFHRLADRLLSGEPYSLQALFLYYTNPLYSSAEPDKIRRALEKIPFMVSFSPFMDESTAYSDIILPDHTYLERWQDDVPDPAVTFPVFGLRQPVIEPLYNTMNSGDVFLKLAKALGSPMAEALPWPTFVDLIKERVKGLWKAQQNSMGTNGSFEELWNKLLSEGGWWAPVPWEIEQESKPKDGKRFYFYSTELYKRLKAAAEYEQLSQKDLGLSFAEAQERVFVRLGIVARGDKVYMPHYVPLQLIGNKDEFPFHLIVYKTMTQAEGRGANVPNLQEIFGLQVRKQWDSWVEMNPRTAELLGVVDGDEVWVESPVGRLKGRVVLFPGVSPEMVHIPHGLGHQDYGHWAKGRGINPNWLLQDQCDLLGGTAAWFSTRVKMYKA